MLTAVYEGPLSPFYAGTHAYYWDPTLRYQAPRPGSHAWYDPTLTYQAERGGLYGSVAFGADLPAYIANAPDYLICKDRAKLSALISGNPDLKKDIVAGCLYRSWKSQDVMAARMALSWVSVSDETEIVKMMSFDLQSDPGFSAFYQEARLKTISRGAKIAVGTGVVLALGALALFTATR